MSKYKLTEEAKTDLKEIAEYTLKKWGIKIFEAYRTGLKSSFESLANNDVLAKPFSKTLPNVMVTKYRYHFIFYIHKQDMPNQAMPVIIAVIHEQRDIIKHLIHRIG